jgi:hypothetical protein
LRHHQRCGSVFSTTLFSRGGASVAGPPIKGEAGVIALIDDVKCSTSLGRARASLKNELRGQHEGWGGRRARLLLLLLLLPSRGGSAAR